MNPTTLRRRRTAVVTAVAAGLLLAGPAAYAAGAASADRDDRSRSTSASAAGEEDPDGTSDGTSGGTSGASEDPGTGSAAHSAAGHDHSSGAGAPATALPTGGGQQDDAPPSGPEDAGKDGQPDQPAAGNVLDVLATDCSGSRLTAHDGFQKAPRCVSTAFGEVADADRSPSLLITKAPDRVGRGEAFSLTVSTRNLVRDRFLPAAQGGYYKETSLLNAEGLQRGHFHTACRMLPDPGEAPDASPKPLFFQATEDGGGGSTPDSVTIDVPGIGETGRLQCSSWAGDGSHRTPMMQRADQTPAFDSVRIEVG
ncbi:hypothetical protein [Pseudonocardia spirodelae]|uniref:Pecanex-like protein 1 n=1 Tax=Pseudonocardia spirodelae TaxID=3133431 RepID=A0ABU8T5Q4_9PSEU